MAKSNIASLAVSLLLLLLSSLFVSSVSNVWGAEISETPPAVMRSGVLAHEMNESQAQILSANGFSVEADVVINNSTSKWQNIYQLSKENNITLIGKLDHITMNWDKNFTIARLEPNCSDGGKRLQRLG